MKLILRTDGASRGNPGPAAAGIVIKNEKGKTVAEFGARLGNMTNNEAEYRALLLGIERAVKLGATALVIQLDSELLIRQLEGQYRVRAGNLKPLHERTKRALANFPHVALAHVPRILNRRADELANEVLDEN